MPQALEKCVQGVMKDGGSKESAYAICAKQTGWVRSKDGWKNTRTQQTYNTKTITEFLDMCFKDQDTK